MSLEKIIRPFQTREITPPKTVVSGSLISTTVATATPTAETVKIDIGKSWSVKSLNGSETIDITYYIERWMKEKKAPTGQQSVI